MKEKPHNGMTVSVIKIVFKKRGDYVAVSSPDLPELHLGGRDIEALMRDIPRAVKWLFKMNYGFEIEILPDNPIENLRGPSRGFQVPVATNSIHAVAVAA